MFPPSLLSRVDMLHKPGAFLNFFIECEGQIDFKNTIVKFRLKQNIFRMTLFFLKKKKRGNQVDSNNLGEKAPFYKPKIT